MSRSQNIVRARRPIVHPVLGPTIHRPTCIIPSVFQKMRPIPMEVLPSDQVKLPPVALVQPKILKTTTALKLVRSVIESTQKNSSEWPKNLRVEDNFSSRKKWGEGMPDNTEWLGVGENHRHLMLSLRAER
ncbi:hypothetical protein BY996DRAFT_4600007 [Phakopsora pachyrhizi]|uniref:Uncharacterized protein n=1 Tax=Phakopsora pachyrhizi TaxID=170000 RepID=A0AAV0BL30_PHAPC|nr:hypothetical protein BY996DRAFT_4600007 [Phakopsora pachyrhizi]CAH7670875.1 hypothetical protein PPACK8108_LOCUS5620 [Phakopsora pachyrhizi]CAH7687759.1 hypothetical protein PPACK8108_LOCUS22594 [Phakopsora pachyrhizi]